MSEHATVIISTKPLHFLISQSFHLKVQLILDFLYCPPSPLVWEAYMASCKICFFWDISWSGCWQSRGVHDPIWSGSFQLQLSHCYFCQILAGSISTLLPPNPSGNIQSASKFSLLEMWTTQACELVSLHLITPFLPFHTAHFSDGNTPKSANAPSAGWWRVGWVPSQGSALRQVGRNRLLLDRLFRKEPVCLSQLCACSSQLQSGLLALFDSVTLSSG